MKEEAQKERILAVEKYQKGESPTAICRALGHSKFWLYKWLKRYKTKKKGLVRRGIESPATLSGSHEGGN